jgi:hypothetical protein
VCVCVYTYIYIYISGIWLITCGIYGKGVKLLDSVKAQLRLSQGYIKAALRLMGQVAGLMDRNDFHHSLSTGLCWS